MKTATVRQVRHDFGSVLHWIEDGEAVEIKKRGKVVAVMHPPRAARARKVKLPDFAARLKRIFGDKVLPTTGADIVADDRARY
jgi:antitoxin (DNA-binding transcriptional repressor) of toxin-antitoxin stability system